MPPTYSWDREMFAEVGSDVTSTVFCVEGAESITLNILGQDTSDLTLQGSNAPRGSAIDATDWSLLTAVADIAGQQLLSITPGFRWIRALRSNITEAQLLASWG